MTCMALVGNPKKAGVPTRLLFLDLGHGPNFHIRSNTPGRPLTAKIHRLALWDSGPSPAASKRKLPPGSTNPAGTVKRKPFRDSPGLFSVTRRVMPNSEDMPVGTFDQHLPHIPFLAVRFGKDFGPTVLDEFVILVDVVHNQAQPGTGISLILFAKEYFHMISVNTAKCCRTVPFPFVFKFQLVNKIGDALRNIRGIEDWNRFVKFHGQMRWMLCLSAKSTKAEIKNLESGKSAGRTLPEKPKQKDRSRAYPFVGGPGHCVRLLISTGKARLPGKPNCLGNSRRSSGPGLSVCSRRCASSAVRSRHGSRRRQTAF